MTACSILVDGDAGFAQSDPMSTQTHLHLRITLASSAKQRVEELAYEDRRSVANYVQILIERDQRQKENHEA